MTSTNGSLRCSPLTPRSCSITTGWGQTPRPCCLSPLETTPNDYTARHPSRPCAGVSPIEASPGKAQRRRLNRGGDRQANRALYSIVLSRLRWDTRSRNYIQRRISEGRTPRKAIRYLKRYVARDIYQLIKPISEPTQQPPAT